MPVVEDAECAFGIRTDYDYLESLVARESVGGGRPDASEGSRPSVGEGGGPGVSEESQLDVSERSRPNEKGSVVVFDVGDLARLYEANLSYAEKTVTAMRRRIVERLDCSSGRSSTTLPMRTG